ncbi:MAG: aldehyde ferredoxin oxidoreductase family protein [Anaerolineaceae bacterium]
MKGYTGKLLRINLSSMLISEENLNPTYLRDYIGGSGLGIRLMYDEVPPETDPLGPEAKIFITTGPVTATSLGTAGRFQVIFKSPLTGILCDSSSGGHWGSEFKQTGYDVLVIEGKAPEPVYINIKDGITEIRPASHLTGKDTYETQSLLQAEVSDDKARVLCIGPGGEAGALYAAMINDTGRAPARGGPGAVMGSKNLKAIVVRGTQKVELADPDGFKRYAVEINKRNGRGDETKMLRIFGTPEVMDNNWQVGDIPVKNWSVGSYEKICVSLGGQKMYDTILVPHNACHLCPIGCSRWVKIETQAYKMDGPGPEYESIGALGSMTLVDDLEAVSYANHLCNIYGLDTISCGSSIAFAMECYEKGLITKEDTGGLDLTWGNAQALIQLVEMVGKGEGFGKFVGQGTRLMANQLGNNSIDFAVQVKGLELPMHDARAFFSWASNYATSPRGGCHLHGMSAIYENKQDPIPEWGLTGYYPRHSDKGKASITYFAQNWSHILSSMVLCYFATFSQQPSDLASLINYATGWSLSPKDLLVIADRINALHRAYNYRCGIRRADDTLSKRSLTPLEAGGASGVVPDLEFQLNEYYQIRGWEEDGKPSRQVLLDLGLADVARDLYAG